VAGSVAVSAGHLGAAGPGEPVLALLAEEWRSIDELGAGLGEGEWDLPSECPGWTVRDLLSHMVGTERSLLGDPPPPGPPSTAHVRNPVGASNEAWVAARRSLPGAQVLEEFRAVTGRRLEELQSLGEAQWAEPGASPIGTVPYREFMEVRVMDCWVHEQDMRVATGRPGHRHGAVAELALRRVASAMGFVVAKKAGAPDGASVRFLLVGAARRCVDVEVQEGRGRVGDLVPLSGVEQADTAGDADHASSQPTVSLEMDIELFWRLGCGRVTGEAALDAELVGVRGDVELGRSVVRNMAFMI
jgi:uncharacterized protein (TIGR03083 family)